MPPKAKAKPKSTTKPPSSTSAKPDPDPSGSTSPSPVDSQGKGKAKSKSGARVLYWFRTDLRLHDSPALKAALDLEEECEGGIEAFWPVWCFDPQYVWKHRVGVNRWQFLLQSMSALSSSLTALNPSQKLHVLRGSPEKVLPVVWKEWGITHLVFEKDTAAYARQRDALILSLAREHFPSLKIIIKQGHNLLDPEEVVKKGMGGKCVHTLVQWKGAAAKVGEIPRPLPPPTTLPNPGPTTISTTSPPEDALKALKETRDELKLEDNKGDPLHRDGEEKGDEGNRMDGPFARLEGINVNGEIMDDEKFDCFETIAGPDGDFAVPTLASLGLPSPTTHISGGEPEALRRLSSFLSNPKAVATFSKPASAPTSLEPSTTLLSPYLKFGCLSVRKFWWDCKDVIEGYKPEKGEKVTKEPENILGQLEFREMYYCAEYATSKYDRIHGSSLSRFIGWKLMNKYDESGKLIEPRPMGEQVDEERFAAWKEGRTGFPWIDAVMRQLRLEGWIHHLARHSVACFLTRGQCYISWERGAEVFDEYLLDWDPASNPGNWMWLSCSAFFSQYYRVYGLESWPSKTDKAGQFVRKYCPELANYPDKYIYNPSAAPKAVQEKAGCIIGSDYPLPMLDEKVEKERCIARVKIAYAVGFHGDSPEVLDGTAEEILKQKFRDEMGRDEDVDDGADPVAGKKRKGEPVDNGPIDKFVKRKK